MLTGRSVLIVEDDPEIAILWTFVVENMNASVIGPFSTGEDALVALTGQTPDLALLDIRLAHGTSYPVGHALARQGVPFLFVSSENPQAIPPTLRSAPLLRKPTAVRDLISALEALTEARPPGHA